MARIRDNRLDAPSDDDQILGDSVIYFKLQKNAEFHIFRNYFQDNDGTLLIHNGSTPSFHQIKQKTFSKYEVIELNFIFLFWLFAPFCLYLQSLDYEICDNELYQNDIKFRESHFGFHKDVARWIMFILIGIPMN